MDEGVQVFPPHIPSDGVYTLHCDIRALFRFLTKGFPIGGGVLLLTPHTYNRAGAALILFTHLYSRYIYSTKQVGFLVIVLINHLLVYQ